jgi:hypothetical protein
MRHLWTRVAFVGLAVLAGALRPANAALTTVDFSSERKLVSSADPQVVGSAGTTFNGGFAETIMYKLYGQNGFKYERVDDTATPGDRLWPNSLGLLLQATVKYAGQDSRFGYFENSGSNPAGPTGDALTNWRPVFETTGQGFYDGSLNNQGEPGITVTFVGIDGVTANVLGPNSFLLTPAQTGSPIEFGLRSPPGATNPLFSSNQSSAQTNLADQGHDHMVTFRILNSDGSFTGRYALAWEDRLLAGSDKDYNDLVLEVTAVPEPASLAVAGLGTLAIFGYGWRRRRLSRAS